MLTSICSGWCRRCRRRAAIWLTPLRDAGKGTSGGFRRARLSAASWWREVALSLVLLAGAAC